jgi:hypothetical protein
MDAKENLLARLYKAQVFSYLDLWGPDEAKMMAQIALDQAISTYDATVRDLAREGRDGTYQAMYTLRTNVEALEDGIS